jgi:hypothetical protein
MPSLITTPHFDAADDFYEALINAHHDLSSPQSHELNAKLVLLLANHIGDQAVLTEALSLARDNVLRSAESAATTSSETP